jgi:hypothetical protein
MIIDPRLLRAKRGGARQGCGRYRPRCERAGLRAKSRHVLFVLMTGSHDRPEHSCDLPLTVNNPVIAAGGPSSSWFFVATRDRLHVSQQITKLPMVDLDPIIQVEANTVLGIVAKLLLDCGNPSCPRLMPPAEARLARA